jgi:hypothetical protein
MTNQTVTVTNNVTGESRDFPLLQGTLGPAAVDTHWMEMMADPNNRIGRPRQIYHGPTQRDYLPLSQR